MGVRGLKETDVTLVRVTCVSLWLLAVASSARADGGDGGSASAGGVNATCHGDELPLAISFDKPEGVVMTLPDGQKRLFKRGLALCLSPGFFQSKPSKADLDKLMAISTPVEARAARSGAPIAK